MSIPIETCATHSQDTYIQSVLTSSDTIRFPSKVNGTSIECVLLTPCENMAAHLIIEEQKSSKK